MAHNLAFDSKLKAPPCCSQPLVRALYTGNNAVENGPQLGIRLEAEQTSPPCSQLLAAALYTGDEAVENGPQLGIRLEADGTAPTLQLRRGSVHVPEAHHFRARGCVPDGATLPCSQPCQRHRREPYEARLSFLQWSLNGSLRGDPVGGVCCFCSCRDSRSGSPGVPGLEAAAAGSPLWVLPRGTAGGPAPPALGRRIRCQYGVCRRPRHHPLAVVVCQILQGEPRGPLNCTALMDPQLYRSNGTFNQEGRSTVPL
jgi:hypothetical protein